VNARRQIFRGLLAMAFLGGALLRAQTSPQPAPEQSSGQTASPDQNSGQAQEPDQNGAQPAATQAGEAESQEPTASGAGRSTQAPTPLPLNIDASSLRFDQEQRERSNTLLGGINAEATYDDNLLSQPSSRVGGFAYSIFPDIGVDITRPRLMVDLNYDGGYTFNQRFTAYDQSLQNGKFDIRYRLSPHVNLRVHEQIVWTTGFYNQLQSGAAGLGTGIVQQPNIGVITPLARHLDNTSTAELTYQYSASDMVGGSATVDISNFGAPATGGSSLVNSRSEEGDAFYTHRFTPRNWSGIAYSFQRLSFSPVSETVDTHSIYLFHTLYLTPHTSLAFFAGPEYTDLTDQIVTVSLSLPVVTVTSVVDPESRWAAAGGASFSWLGSHTSIRASGVRKVSDGGGLLTAVDMTTGEGAVRRQLTRSSSLEVGVIYAASKALDAGATTFYDNLKSVSGSVQWEQHLGKNFTSVMGYARDYQQENGPSVTGLNVNHNRGWVTIGYQFSRPLGR
jgi:hypothetical protein